MNTDKKTMPKRAKFAIINDVQYNWNLDVISLEDTLPLLMEAASKGLDQRGIIDYVNSKIPAALVVAGAGRGKTAIPIDVRISWTKEYLSLLERVQAGDNSAKSELQDKFGRVIIASNGQVAEDTWQALVTRYDRSFAERVESAKARKTAKANEKIAEKAD